MMAGNLAFAVGLVRGTLGGGGGDLRLAGLVGASDGLIDFGSPEIEIDEASTDGEPEPLNGPKMSSELMRYLPLSRMNLKVPGQVMETQAKRDSR